MSNFMGIFDLLSPFFSWFDALLGQIISPILRLIFWGIVSSILSMWLYKLLSPQEKLAQNKIAVAETKKTLAKYDDDFEGALQLSQRLLGLSLKQVGLALGPAILASLPVVFLLVWLGGAYDYRLPAPKAMIDIQISPPAAEVQWQPADAQPGLEPGEWQISWPNSEEPLSLHDSTGQLIATFPLSKPVPILHQYQWWNILFANPAGYIPDQANLESVEIAIPENQYLNFGPDWMRSSIALFLIVVIICSLAIKFIFRIH